MNRENFLAANARSRNLRRTRPCQAALWAVDTESLYQRRTRVAGGSDPAQCPAIAVRLRTGQVAAAARAHGRGAGAVRDGAAVRGSELSECGGTGELAAARGTGRPSHRRHRPEPASAASGDGGRNGVGSETKRVSGERVGGASTPRQASGTGAVLDPPGQLRPEETAGQSGDGASGELAALSGKGKCNMCSKRCAPLFEDRDKVLFGLVA